MYLWFYILITVSPILACLNRVQKPEPPVTVHTSTSKEEPKHLKVGENKAVECSYSYPTQLVLRQYFPAVNLTFNYPAATNVKKYIFQLTIGEFDNNTILKCDKSQNQKYKQINSTKWTVLNSATKYSQKNEKYYDEETSVECDCSNYSVSGVKTSVGTFGRGVLSYLIQVKPNRQVQMFSHEKVSKMNVTKADNNSVLYCLCIVVENKTHYYEVTRHVKEIGLFKYQEKKGGESESLSKSYFYIGGAIIGLIVLALIFIVFWKRNKSKKAASENNNEDPTRITYAELELKSVPNNRRTLKIDETPYAEIVLHENQPYLHCETRAENTESPYANC